MTERTKFLSYSLEHQWPHPISAPFRAAQTANNPTDRAVFYMATLDSFLRYSTAILLSDFFSKAPSEEKVAKVLPNLLFPRPARWCELLLELAEQLAGTGPFMPELVRGLIANNGERTGAARRLLKLSEQVQSLLENRQAIIKPEAATETAQELEQGLLTILEEFNVMERYPLALLRRHAAESQNGFRGFLMRWMGYGTVPLPIAVEFENTVPEETPLLLSPDGRKGLELAPFVAITELRGRGHEGVFVCAGMRHEHAVRLEHFNSGRFQVHNLTLDGEPHSLFDYMSNWGQGGSVTNLSPTESTSKRFRFKSKLLPTEQVLENRYKTLGFMGRGGIGAVYRVYDMEEATDKAVKILYPDLSRNEFFTRYFIDTGRLLSKLESDHLVPVHDAGFSSALQENHMVMSHMRGGSLAEMLERRDTLGARVSLQIAQAMLEGIAAVHAGGLVHGGIHPGNILFDDQGTPRVADFGILRLPSSRVTSFRPLERLHSLRYAAPELLLGGQASGRSDIYSAAIVIYEMLTGRVPSKTEWVPPSDLIFPIPEALDEALHKALKPAPDKRFESATEFAAELRRIESEMGPEYEVSATAQALQLLGHLADVEVGHTEALDVERKEKEAAGDFEGAARVLQLKIDELWDIDERVYWMQELAGLYFERLDKPGKAVSLYRDCLELAPDNPVAVAAIMGHFERTDQWEELAGVLDELKDGTDLPERRSEYLQRLVELYHERLGDALSASRYLEELVDATGDHQTWLEMLVLLKEEAQDWDGAAKALERWRDMATDPEEVVPILRRLAAIYHKELENHEAAVLAYEHLVAMGAADVEVLNALRTLYRGAFSYAALAQLLRKMVKGEELPGERRVELYQELGEILSSYLYNPKEAVDVWSELLTIDQTNQTALSYLERIYLREGQTEAYLAILNKKAEATEDTDEKVAVLVSAAQAYLEFMADEASAQAMLEKAHGLQPGNAVVEGALEQVYDDTGNTDALGQLLLERLDRETKPGHRLRLLRRLTRLFAESDNASAAYEVAKRTFSEAPTDPGARSELERLAAETGTFEDLVTFYMESLADADGQLGRYLAGRVAAICAEHIEDPDKALYALETAMELMPESEALHRSLLVIYRDAERWPDLAEVMIHSLKEADGKRRAELLEEVALLIKNRLDGKEQGRKLLEELVQAAEAIADTGALYSLLDACSTLGEWTKVAEVGKRLLETEKEVSRVQELRLAVGQAYLHLEEWEKAKAWLQDTLEKAPQDAAVQQALEDALVAQEDWQGLVDLYRKFIPFTSDKELRGSYLEKAAEIEANVFENLDAAIELYRQLVSLEPDRLDYARRLSEALKKAERYTELTWQYEQMTQRADPAERSALLREVAEIHYTHLDNPDAAIQTLRQLLREAPGEQEVLDRVREICLAEKRYETLLRVLGDRTRIVEEKTDKWDLKVEMARLSAFEMGLLPPARSYLAEVLAECPGHPGAYELFKEILERQEDWKALAELMSGQFDALAEEADKVELGMSLATLLRERLDLKVAAAEILEKVWELVPDDVRPGLLLARTYSELGRWDKAASLLAVLRERSDQLDDNRLRALVFLSAQAHEALLERASAIEYYRKTIELDYRVNEAEEKLATLLYMDEAYPDARELMMKLLDSGRLSAEKIREFKNLCADIDRKLGRRDKSRDHLESLLAQSPNDAETLRKIIDLCREEGDAGAEACYMEKLLDVETDPERRFPMQVRLGELLKTLPDRLDEAAVALERALELRPDSKVVAIALGDVYTRLERWHQAIKALREAEELETDPQRKAAFAIAQGTLLMDHAGEPERGEDQLRRALQHDPAKLDAFSRLEQMAVEREDWEAQRSLYEMLLERLGEGISRDLGYTLNLNLGRIWLEHFDAGNRALACLDKAASFKPDELEPKRLAAGVLTQMDDELDKAVDVYKALLQVEPRDVETLQALRKTYGKMKRYDEAWYVASVLVMLDAASEKERAFYKRFSSNALKIKPKVLDAETLQKTLSAPEQDFELSEVVRILFERMGGRLQLQTAKDLGLSKKTLLDDASSGLYGKLAATISKVLGIPKPQTHMRGTSAWLAKEACHPPVLVVNPQLLEERKGKAMRFELARVLTLFLPPHLPVGLLDREMLRLLLGNVLKLVITSFPEPPGDARQNLDLRKQMEKAIPAAEQGLIRDYVTALRERGGELNIKRWFVGVDKTALRAGLALSNDVLTAVELARTCPLHSTGVSREVFIDDLLAYAVSDQFTRLREYLGITVL